MYRLRKDIYRMLALLLLLASLTGCAESPAIESPPDISVSQESEPIETPHVITPSVTPPPLDQSPDDSETPVATLDEMFTPEPTSTTPSDDLEWMKRCGDLVNEAYIGLCGDTYQVSYYGPPGYDEVFEYFGEPIKTVTYGNYGRMYFKQGVEIDYSNMSGAEYVLNYIYLSPECALKIGRGIGIGSTQDEVMAAYSEIEIDTSTTTNDLIVIGRYFRGIILVIRDGVVSSIYISTGGFTEEYFPENLDITKPPDDRG